MPVLSVHSVLLGTSAAPVGILNDLDVGLSADGSTVLYATSREGLSISAFDLDLETVPLLDWQSLPGGLSPLGGYGLELVDLGDGLLAVAMASAPAGLPAFALDADGCLPEAAGYLDDGGMNGEAVAMAAASSGGTHYVYAAGTGGEMLSRYVVGSAQTLAAEGGSPVELPGGAAGVTAMISGVVQDQAYLFAADGGGDRVGVYKVKTNGELKQMDEIGAADGLGVDAPSALALVDLNGQSYLILAARGSSSLSVLAVDADGGLRATDHLVDDLTSRFQHVTALDAVVVDGRAYVTAGGADDGVSVFELMPGGRLRLLDSVADGLETSLQNVSAVAMAAGSGGVEIFAGSAIEAGATRMTLALTAGQVLTAPASGGTVQGGSGNDLLTGGAGDDDLRGGGGDDVINGGQGADWLEGGAGADVFVLTADGQRDRIRDFNANEDRLDLSLWPMLRSTAQLTVTSLPDGALIEFGAEELRIYSSNGDALTISQVLGAVTGGFLHFDVSWIRAEDTAMTGTDGDDTLTGGPGDDTLDGLAGNDSLTGGEGDDDLTGGAGQDVLNGGEGDDNLTGDAGNDTLSGDAGDDMLSGGEDDDRLTGGTGADQLMGGAGRDHLDGGEGDDRLEGGAGADVLYGRLGADVLDGGEGADALIGGVGADVLDGGGGNDTLSGGGGDDFMIGGDGDDVLRGRAGADWLQGDDGADRLYGHGGPDVLAGGADQDLLDGGGDGDELYGGGGSDTLLGQRGDDFLQGEGGADQIDGGPGDDTLEGGGGDDRLNGGDGADHLVGGGGNDRLEGKAGADRLLGDKGDDDLSGNGGHDRLDGGGGNDVLTGGTGRDTFVFNAGADVVADFQDNLDTIALDDALWGGGLSVSDLLDRAQVAAGDLLFDFGGGNSLRIVGLTNPNALANDLEIV